ncbi:hypothetical protein [Methanotorris formicicus]|uniref:Uncharacterized protein n=1 Tax=Methanotorris formicicus Mc-S-70 TaxID=647171 RepID=H1KXH3_9EURY|nr:hypothetical protein [Methanotorris formicicus]EHP88276.1 hypothetical protein MetfoDRAFT_0496 [Methanotorris formicicus Mc-S-70]
MKVFLFPSPGRGYKLINKTALDFISSGRNGIKSLVYKYDGTAELEFKVSLNNKSHRWKIIVESEGIVNIFKDEKNVTESKEII